MSDEPETQEAAVKVPAVMPLSADNNEILAVIPRNTEEAARYAKAFIAAGIVPQAYTYSENVLEHGTGNILIRKGDPNKELILMGILKSLEVGLPPITGLGAIVPINNRFTVWGDGAIALIQRNRVISKHFDRRIGPSFDPNLELVLWPDEYGWEVSYWRVGQDEPYVGRFTVKDAKRAKLWNSSRDPWQKYADRMLFNRARAFALRDGFADCLYGLGILEEVRDSLPDHERAAPVVRNYDDDDEPVPALEHAAPDTPLPETEPAEAELVETNETDGQRNLV